MAYNHNTVLWFYKKLLSFYPQEFKEQFGESMEQTFQDIWNEKWQTEKRLFGFIFWTFIETAMGILREYLLLISPGDIMRAMLKTPGISALISSLFILPFMIMEFVNRRNFNEDFPFMLFFVLWLYLFAVSLILLPILLSRWGGKRDTTNSVSTQRNTLLTNPKSALIISGILILIIIVPSLLSSPSREPLEGMNTEYIYAFGIQVPSQFIAFAVLLIPIAAGVIAAGPIARALRAGGSLFAHPMHLTIVVVISFFFAAGVINLIVDQWPCFIGVPVCD